MNDLAEKFKGFLEVEDENKFTEVINSLSDTSKDLESKTDLKNPLHIAFLSAIADNFKEAELTKTSEFLHNFIEHYQSDMISHDRQGRKEIIEALHQIEKREEATLKQKMLGQTQNMNE